jgi:DNA-binding NtrC family response regulator
VETSADKQKALQILNADPYDILICPAPKTTENGDSLPAQARLLRPEISVLLMTEKTAVKRSKTKPGFAADETLTKPFSQSLFLSTLERAYWRSLTRRDKEANL